MKHRIIFIIAVLLSWAGLLRAADDGRTDRITAMSVKVAPGGQSPMRLWLDADDGYALDGQAYRSLQFDLLLPKGVTLMQSEETGEYQYSQGDLFSTGTNVSIAYKELDSQNRYRFIIYNVLNTRLTASSGLLLTLWLQGADNLTTAMQFTGTIDNQKLGQTGDSNVQAEASTFTLTTVGSAKEERGRGLYSRDFNTSNTDRNQFGGYENILVAIDQTEALQKDGHPYRSVQFDLHLPKGIRLNANATTGAFVCSRFQNMTSNHEVSITKHEGEEDTFYRVLLYSLSGSYFGYRHTSEQDSTLALLFTYEGDNTTAFNTGDHVVRIDNQVLGVDADKSVTAAPCEFTIHNDLTRTISEERSSVTPPTQRQKYPVNVDLQVAFKANEWRAFCVPFDLSGEQLTEAFGEGVQLAQGTETGHSLLGNSLHLQFQTCDVANGIVRGKNYLIRTTEDLDSVRLRDVLLIYDSSKTPSGINFFPAVNEQGSTVICMQANNYVRIDGETVTYDNIGIGQLSKFEDVVFISDGQFHCTKKEAPLNAFNAVFYSNAVKAALEGYTDVAYVEPQTEIDLTFEDGQTKTVSGQVVTENGQQYVAVGKTRYEVLETLGKAVGDVNGDESVTIADVTSLVNVILGKSESPGSVADINGDESVTIADVTSLVNIILGKSPGGTIATSYKVRNVSPVVGYVDGQEVFTWGGSADAPQE